MKKFFIFPPAVLLTCLLVTALSGCSKEKIMKGPVSKEPTADNSSAGRIANRGSVTGLVLPGKTEVKIGIYNQNFSSTEFYYTKDGRFRFDGIPPGVYTVVVVDIATSASYEVTEVKVVPGMVTDIRSITIQ